MADLPALKKLSGTVETIVKLAEGVPKFSQAELNAAEAKIRNEFQVIEAHLFHVGQEFYGLVQSRRQELLNEAKAASLKSLNESIKEKEDDREGGSPRPGNGADESSGPKSKSDKQTRKSAGQSGHKKRTGNGNSSN